MRRFAKLWIWVLALLTVAGMLAGIGTAGNRSSTKEMSFAKGPGSEIERQRADADVALMQRAQNGNRLTEQEKMRIEEIRSRVRDRSPRNPMDDQGGPDAFGYAFVDNLAGDTATYSWIELRGDAQATWISSWPNGYDDGCAGSSSPIGFNFPLYGNTYTTFTPTSDGHIEFGTCSSFPYVSCMPNTSWGPAILPYMYDLHLQTGGDPSGNNVVAYRNFGSYTVIEFDSIGYWSSTYAGTSVKFEAILYESGRIKLQYNTTTLAGGAPMGTVGIQDATGTTYLQYRCDTDGNSVRSLDAGRAIWFALPNGIPRPVTNLQGSVNGTTVTLTWVDPDHDTNNNPLTPDSILIYRGNTQPSSEIAHVTHGVQTYVASNQPQGNLNFFVRAKSGAWLSPSVSVNEIVGTPGYSNNFDTDNGGWVCDDGGWTWGAPSNPQAPTPHSGANMWGTGMATNYLANQCTHMDLSPNLEVLSDNATLEFWAWWSTYAFGFYDGCNVKVSVDGGTTWETVSPQGGYSGILYSFNTCLPSDSAWSETSNGWRYIVVPIGQYAGQTPMFRFTLGTYLSGYPGFFVDDMTMWGIATPPNGIPRPPTGFHGSSGGTTTVTFNWTDPTQDTNGNPLTLDSILIYRGSNQPASQIGHAAAGAQTFVATNEPIGNTTYYARAKATTWTSLSVSAPVIVGTPTYNNNFETNDGAWIADNGWTWGAPSNAQAPLAHSGTQMWGTGMTANYTNNQCDHLDLDLGLEVISPSATVEFWAWWSTYPSFAYDGCNFKVSVDGGATWERVSPQGGYNGVLPTFNTCLASDSAWTMTSGGWRYIVLPVGQYMGQTPIFRFTLGTYLSGYPGFFFDDMLIWGLHPIQGANISGTVTLDGGHGIVTQALVAADGYGNVNGHPAGNGSYTLANVQVGHRRLVTSLANYVPDTTHITLDSTGYTGANIILHRVPPPAPANLHGVVTTLARRDSLHWDVCPDTTVDGYRVYRKLADSTAWTLRKTIIGRTLNWTRDTLEAYGVYNYVVTAMDTNVMVPPIESAHSNTVLSPFGHFPPQALRASGNSDNTIHLTWSSPGGPTARELFYDNGVNTGFGLHWINAVPPFGYFVAHFQTDSGPATVTRLKIDFTHNAVIGDSVHIAMFADTGDGTPTFTPLNVFRITQQGPLDSFQYFEVDPPVTFDNGSFFVGARQMSATGVCIGDENTDPFINNMFYAAYSVGLWSTFESQQLMAIPMIRCFAMGSFGIDRGQEVELRPSPPRPMAPVNGFFAHPSETIRAMKGKVSAKKPLQQAIISDQPNGSRPSLDYLQYRARTSIGPRAPYVIDDNLTHHRGRGSLDDVVRYVIYRDGTLRDSVAANVTQYDDVVGSTNENHSYQYYVKARWDDNQFSVPSDTVAGMCNMAPGAPSGVVVTAVGQTQMRINWTDPTVNADGTPCVDLAGLRIYRDGTLITTTPVAPGVHQYTDTPPDPSMIYSWTVKAIDEVPNEGPGSSASGSVISPWHTVDFNWVDITGTGTITAEGDDVNSGPLDLGFSFPYYGVNYTTVNVCSNGWVSFTDQSNSLGVPCPPNTGTPNNAIFAFCADLWPTAGQCKYLADAANQRFIVSWDHCPPCCSDVSPYHTFQIILDPNGGITLQYGAMDNTNGVVGVENLDGSDGVNLWCNSTGPFSPSGNNAVQFWGGPRQSIMGTVQHNGGSHPPLVSGQVWVTGGTDTVMTDDNGHYILPLDPGTYTVNFRHPTHCDTSHANVVLQPNIVDTLNMRMNAPNATLNVSSLTFVVHRYGTLQQPFTITNNLGTCPLTFSVLDSVTWLSSNPATGTVAPNGVATIAVTAAPQQMQPGEYSTTMRVVCNAPGSPFLIQVDMNVLRVEPLGGALPTVFALHQNYPNPFNPTTLLPFDVPQTSQVDIVVYNVMGQEVARPVSGKYSAGRYQASFAAGDLPSGVYLVKMTAGGFHALSKIMLLK